MTGIKLYFAPLEGITTYTYRNVHNRMFGMCDEYYAPFISPTENEKLSTKNMRDILPQNNQVNLKVQCLANNEYAFVDFAERISVLGYDEVNLNLGCPSGTVVKKNKGSGMLRDVERLDEFLGYIFERSPVKISIKTRTGFYSHEEFEKILKVYEKYPIKELIIHPRVREEYYKTPVNVQTFGKAYLLSDLSLCYNGDVCRSADYEKIINRFPRINSVMIGRGALKNPAIFRELSGGARLSTEELVGFSKELEKAYLPVLGSEIYTLHKLKEIWMYAIENYPTEKKICKAIKKSSKLSDLNCAIESLPEMV